MIESLAGLGPKAAPGLSSEPSISKHMTEWSVFSSRRLLSLEKRLAEWMTGRVRRYPHAAISLLSRSIHDSSLVEWATGRGRGESLWP